MSVGEVVGVTDIPDLNTVPFIVVRLKEKMDDSNYKERMFLKAGEGVTFERYSRTMLDSGPDFSLAGEGRLKHFKVEKKIIIYSTPGPSHKLTFSLLKEKFPQYNSIIWRDG